jgi:hypothetical protein
MHNKEVTRKITVTLLNSGFHRFIKIALGLISPIGLNLNLKFKLVHQEFISFD